MFCYISISYDEGRPETYRHVAVKSGEEPCPRIFATGNPVKDYEAALEFAHNNFLVSLLTSSVHDFANEAGLSFSI